MNKKQNISKSIGRLYKSRVLLKEKCKKQLQIIPIWIMGMHPGQVLPKPT